MRSSIGFAVIVALAAPACENQRARVGEDSARLGSPAEAETVAGQDGLVELTLTAATTEASGYRYAYNQQNPGPTIRAQVGDEIVVHLRNELDAPTTIHWHGLEVPFEMDGATWQTAPIEPGGRFSYRFVVQQAGTFWYHPHFNTEAQVEGGLYGALIVEDPSDPVADEELVLVFDSVGEKHVGAKGHGHGRSRYRWRVNGVERPRLSRTGGRTVRARILNVSNADYLDLRWPKMRIIGQDQGLRSRLESPARIVLSPGDRVEAEILLGEEDLVLMAHPYSLNGGSAVGEPAEVLRLAVEEGGALPAPLDWGFEPRKAPVVPRYADIVYALAGSDRTGRWFINGERYPEITLETVPLGSTAIIEVRNLSPTEHPFHMHGMTFGVLARNGIAEPTLEFEDTINLKIRETLMLQVTPKTAGEWMTHCHILPHAGDGMMTVLRVR